MPLPTPIYQNSAGRLLAILTGIPTGNVVLEMIPRLFDAPAATPEQKQSACVAGLLEINKLYLEFRQDMHDFVTNEQQRNVILSGVSSIQQSIYYNNLGAGYRALTESEKALLEVAATMLPSEDGLQENEIGAIKDSINALRKQVQESGISPTLRKTLLELIRLSEDAISRFNIHGARGLRRAFKSMLGEVAEAYGLASAQDECQEIRKSPAWEPILKHLRTFDGVVSRLLKYKPILERATRFFLGGP